MLLHGIGLDLLADLADGGLISTLTEPVAGGSYATEQANFRRDLTCSPNIGLPRYKRAQGDGRPSSFAKIALSSATAVAPAVRVSATLYRDRSVSH